jgi:hypothetical protein
MHVNVIWYEYILLYERDSCLLTVKVASKSMQFILFNLLYILYG